MCELSNMGVVIMIYLDNAATTFPKPKSVSRAIYRFLNETAANPGRSGHALSMAAAREVYRCREAVASLFHAPGPECVAFTQNATYAINLALKGALRGGHVVPSDLEHNAVMRPLTALKAAGVTFDTAQVDLQDDDATVENFRRLLRPETVMVVCTHASNVCGRALPIGRLGELCRERGVAFLVDASQSAGVLPIDVEAMHIDYLCTAGHKSLYGPMGTGLLITAKGESLGTIVEGGTGSNSVSLEQPDFMPDRMESGTLNAPGIAGLRAGIEFLQRVGMDRIRQQEERLMRQLYDGLRDLPGVILYTPRPETGYVPVVSFNIGEMSSVDAVTRLDRLGFALRGGLHCAPTAHRRFGTLDRCMIRVGIGAFNTPSDIRALLAAVKNMASV